MQIGRIEDSVTPDKIDLALMSYSLSGLPMENRGSFLSRLFEAKNPQGKVLYVTYEDGCNWDIFSSYVYEFLGRPIKGGVNLHKQELESLGFNSEILSKATTLIWGSSLDDLAEVLAFFFLDKLEQYLADISKFKTLLKEVSHQMPDGRSAIEVVEALVEVKPSLNLV